VIDSDAPSLPHGSDRVAPVGVGVGVGAKLENFSNGSFALETGISCNAYTNNHLRTGNDPFRTFSTITPARKSMLLHLWRGFFNQQNL
jgi:hypothetical protein